jgi:WXG100 family type VII secretion target
MANGTSILIDPIKVAEAAKVIDNQKSIIKNGIDNIIQTANSLSVEWEGESAEAYKDKIRFIQPNLLEIVNILDEYVYDLTQISNRFASNESTLKSKNEALPSDVFGV